MSVCLSVCQLYVRPSVSFTELPAWDMPIFSFPDDNLVNINGFSPNLVCALILWRSGLGLLMGKFRQIFTELSARDTIMAGYYSWTFLLLWKFYCVRQNMNNSCQNKLDGHDIWQEQAMVDQPNLMQECFRLDTVVYLVNYNKRKMSFLYVNAQSEHEVPGPFVESLDTVGLLHWYWWILSRVGISKDASLRASFDFPTRDNIHQYQCNNAFII